jgi:hypothetical protein
MIRTIVAIVVLAAVIILINRFSRDGTQERLAQRRMANSMSQGMRDGQRVDVRLHLGEADVWYAGTALHGNRVQLDDYPYGASIAEPGEILDWRPQSGQFSE